MNIKEAKTEIMHTVQAYTQKNERGGYRIPLVRQRPVLLMGPPGIGKTAIMEQIAQECGLGLVAYTITHHTRQSAVGLPMVQTKLYGGKEYAVTEYTMSEIIASVYECMERTGKREGILFIDEINCVSETLAPTMLQFLQAKTFGSHKVPDGWIIVAAGNPPEYNKSVREFDIVTLDRVKKIDITEDYGVWKEYACLRGIHGCVLSYLNIKTGNFYRVEQDAASKAFVTARGWEDLSQILFAYEEMGYPCGYDLMIQYLQDEEIARDFANYYQLYRKYRDDYRIPEILLGTAPKTVLKEKEQLLSQAQLDERLTVTGLILSCISRYFKEWKERETQIEDLHQMLLLAKPRIEKGQELQPLIEDQKRALQVKEEAGLISEDRGDKTREILEILATYQLRLRQERIEETARFHRIRDYFQELLDTRAKETQLLKQMLDRGFSFMRQAMKEGMEMTVFVTDLSKNAYVMEFVEQHGCPQYIRYSKAILFSEREKELQKEIAALGSSQEE